ncbi:hypothetical protein FB451DRAFT_1213941 [Mycena latifolia]|nr:hypothetical protein FB451DRAFT_1213941 [Mycena latifolia]
MSTPATRRRRARKNSESEPQGPPTKRRRVAEDTVIEDPTCSIDDRVCFLRVETHLFKVHLFHLLRDEESVFHDMLAMPPGAAAPQGSSRENPVVLVGDTLAQIRAFHKLAYASPLQAQITAYQRSDLASLIECGFFAHKYAMTSFLQLALDAIVSIATRHSFDGHPIATNTALLRLTWLQGAPLYNTAGTREFEIRELIRRSWMAQVRTQRSFDHMKIILERCQQYDFRALLGEVYHEYLRRMSFAHREPGHGPRPARFPDPSLFELHRARLMTGYWSLNECWDEFVTNVPPVPVSEGCFQPVEHATVCAAEWERLWRAASETPAVRATSTVDILRKLRAFHGAIDGPWSTGCYRLSFDGLHPVSEYIRKLQDSLADHFMGPLHAA